MTQRRHLATHGSRRFVHPLPRRCRAQVKKIDPLSGQWTAFKGNSVHQAVVALVVVERMVPSAAIVPNRHRAWAPLKATDEPILRRMLIKIVEQSHAFFASPADNAGCEGRIDIQHGLAAAGVS